MKRTVSILLAVLMLASLFSVYAAADAKMSFNISSDTALPGEEVALYVSFSNNPGVAAFNGSITYDHNALELESIEGLISGGMWDVEDAATDDSFFWSNTSNYTSNSNVMKLNFKVKSAAAPGSYTVGIYFDPDWDIVSNIDEQQIDVNIVSGAITVTSPVCTHASKTTVAAKNSTCKEQGWDKYYKCDDCGQLFAADGVTKLDAIPLRPLAAHSFDSNGKCTRCDATVPVLKLKSQVTSVEVGKEMAIRADVFNVEGVHVEWACSSLNASIAVSEDTLTCTVSGNSAGAATVYARLVYDDDGTDVISDEGTTSASYGVTVKAPQENQSFFSKLISWFKDLFSKIFFFC